MIAFGLFGESGLDAPPCHLRVHTLGAKDTLTRVEICA